MIGSLTKCCVTLGCKAIGTSVVSMYYENFERRTECNVTSWSCLDHPLAIILTALANNRQEASAAIVRNSCTAHQDDANLSRVLEGKGSR